MIDIIGMNNNTEKSRFLVVEKERCFNKILKAMTRINDLYNTNNSKSINERIEVFKKEYKNIYGNNNKYIEVFRENINSYKASAKEYEKNFETLGDV